MQAYLDDSCLNQTTRQEDPGKEIALSGNKRQPRRADAQLPCEPEVQQRASKRGGGEGSCDDGRRLPYLHGRAQDGHSRGNIREEGRERETQGIFGQSKRASVTPSVDPRGLLPAAMSDAYDFRPGGSLKLKGADGGVKKYVLYISAYINSKN